MPVNTIEDIIEEIISSTKNNKCKWNDKDAFFGQYTGQMHNIPLILTNLQDETTTLTFNGYGTYRGGQILRNLVSAVLDQFPSMNTAFNYPVHNPLEPARLLRAWTPTDD